MKRITDELPIKTWKDIAEIVLKTNASKLSIKDFDLNLAIIKKFITDLDIYVDDIRISTFLKTVYETKGYWNVSKFDFTEYIQKLEMLGVKNIEFNPYNFPTIASNYLELEENSLRNYTRISKYYTDGKFKLYKPTVTFYRDNFRYKMEEIKDASFLIYTNILHEVPYSEKEPVILESNAIVKDFNGILPSMEDVINVKYPRLNIHSRKIDWCDSPVYSEIYKEFTHEEFQNKQTKKVKSLTFKNQSDI